MSLPPTSRPPALPRLYGGLVLRTLRAAIATLRPVRGKFSATRDEAVLETALGFIPYLPPLLRYSLPFGLFYVEFAPCFYGYGMQRFSRMDAAAAGRYLSALESSHGPFQMAYQGIRSLVMLSFYQQPEVLAVLEIDVPSRAQELIERRARLLKMAPELGNPRNAERIARREAERAEAARADGEDGAAPERGSKTTPNTAPNTAPNDPAGNGAAGVEADASADAGGRTLS